MNNKIKKELITAKKVSEYLQIPVRTVQHLSQTGRIRAIRIGGRWRYLKEDIERYVSFGTDFSKEPERKSDPLIRASHASSQWGEGNNPAERRAYPRINSNFICGYSVNHEPIRKAKGAGEVKNISAGGVFVIGRDGKVKNIYIDDPISLDFVLNIDDGESINIHTKGRVVRKTDNGLGIKFRSISKEYQDEIARYVG